MDELECIRRLLEIERAKSAILTESLNRLLSGWPDNLKTYRPKPVFQDNPAEDKKDSDCSLSFVISVIALITAGIALCLILKHL